MCIYILPCARRPGPGRESVCEYCKWHSDSVSVREKRFTFFVQSDNGLYKQPNDLAERVQNFRQEVRTVPLLIDRLVTLGHHHPS